VKQILQEYASYNTWANQLIVDNILLLPEELTVKEVPSSFSTLHGTLVHMWNAESIWWQRMKMQEMVTLPGLNFKGNTPEVANAMLAQNKLWESWVTNATQLALEHVFHYQNTKKEQFKQPIYQMLLHMFNHGTYHRGQLVTMLRQLGVQQLPSTDFIVWSRRKK
jgi:uncharacterized damage-inducible protein DinB